MPELDAEIRTVLLQVRDRAASDVDVEACLAELHSRRRGRTTGRRWGAGLLAAAAAIALVAGSLVVFDRGDDRVLTGPAVQGVVHDDAAKEELDRAVRATLDAPGWVAELRGGVGRTRFSYQHPDRIESDSYDTEGSRLQHNIAIDGDHWFFEGGEWIAQERPWRAMAPITLLDALGSACAAQTDDGLLAWDGSDGCDRPVDEIVDGTDVWLVSTDGEGRLAAIDIGEVRNAPVDPDVPRPGLNRLAGLPVGATLNLTFRYDEVPEVRPPEDGPVPAGYEPLPVAECARYGSLGDAHAEGSEAFETCAVTILAVGSTDGSVGELYARSGVVPSVALNDAASSVGQSPMVLDPSAVPEVQLHLVRAPTKSFLGRSGVQTDALVVVMDLTEGQGSGGTVGQGSSSQLHADADSEVYRALESLLASE